MITPEARRRLAGLMEQRMADLRLTWREVAEAGEISYEALRAARNGTGDIRRNTQAGIEDGLRWERGSVGRVLAGGDPAPLADAAETADTPAAPVIPPLRVVPANPELADYIDAVRAQLAEAVRKYGPRFTGIQAFGEGSWESDTWTDPDGDLLDDDAKVRVIARIRRAADKWRDEQRNAL